MSLPGTEHNYLCSISAVPLRQRDSVAGAVVSGSIKTGCGVLPPSFSHACTSNLCCTASSRRARRRTARTAAAAVPPATASVKSKFLLEGMDFSIQESTRHVPCIGFIPGTC